MDAAAFAERFHELDGTTYLGGESDDAAAGAAVVPSVLFGGVDFPLVGFDRLLVRRGLLVHNGHEELTLHLKLRDIVARRSGWPLEARFEERSYGARPTLFVVK